MFGAVVLSKALRFCFKSLPYWLSFINNIVMHRKDIAYLLEIIYLLFKFYGLFSQSQRPLRSLFLPC